MQDKKAIEILTRMLEAHQLSDEEKEAVATAIGILSWTKLGQARIKNMGQAQKLKREQDLKDHSRSFLNQ